MAIEQTARTLQDGTKKMMQNRTKQNRQNIVDKRKRGVVSAGQIVKPLDYNENLESGRGRRVDERSRCRAFK
jgi:hypothetical protein